MEQLGRQRATGPWRQLRRVFPSPPLGQVFAMFLIFLLPLLVLPRVIPQPSGPAWQHINSWPVDRGVQRIIVRPMGRTTSIYVVSAGGELYWSGNEGQKWFHMGDGLGRAPLEQRETIDLAVDPEDAKIIHAVIGSSFTFAQPMVYWTMDMGLNWQARASLGRERVRAIAYGPTRDELYVITNTDLLKAMVLEGRSNDAEALQESFIQREDNLYWVSLAPFEADTWVTSFVASRLPEEAFPLLTSITGSATAQGSEENAAVLYIGTQKMGLQIIVHTQQGTFRPADTGQDAASLYVLGKATIYTVSMDPQQPTRLYVGTDMGLYTSADGGRHWATLGEHSLSGPVLGFLNGGRDGDTMYVGTSQKGVLYSQDGGHTWEPLGHGIKQAHIDSLAMSETNGSRVLYAGTRSGLWQISLP
jgi:photosystem II stability/assembly factor-like uncharacterized protein